MALLSQFSSHYPFIERFVISEIFSDKIFGWFFFWFGAQEFIRHPSTISYCNNKQVRVCEHFEISSSDSFFSIAYSLRRKCFPEVFLVFVLSEEFGLLGVWNRKRKKKLENRKLLVLSVRLYLRLAVPAGFLSFCQVL